MAPENPMLQDLAATIRELRKDRSWSRRVLADRAQVSERFLAEIEAGRANPSLLKLGELARALGTTVDALICERPAANPAAEKRAVVALLGLRGAGKSTVGPKLAAAMGLPFVELDHRIEASQGLRLQEMFELHGEAYYRRAERRELEQLLASGEVMVLAVGGGLVTEPETFDVLKDRAHTVWLQAAPEDHWTRVVAQGDTRPMADDDKAFAHLCAILTEREKLYQEAQMTVNTSQHDVDEITDQLALRFQFLAAG
jgi:XRE family aerobic/anaerobic benzoate catabolism transcriptional regulator